MDLKAEKAKKNKDKNERKKRKMKEAAASAAAATATALEPTEAKALQSSPRLPVLPTHTANRSRLPRSIVYLPEDV